LFTSSSNLNIPYLRVTFPGLVVETVGLQPLYMVPIRWEIKVWLELDVLPFSKNKRKPERVKRRQTRLSHEIFPTTSFLLPISRKGWNFNNCPFVLCEGSRLSGHKIWNYRAGLLQAYLCWSSHCSRIWTSLAITS